MNKTEPELFSDRLRIALERAGIPRVRGQTQRVADKMGVPHTAVSKWLSGQQMPDNERIVTLAKWLEVSAEWLMSGRGSPDISSLSEENRAVLPQRRLARSPNHHRGGETAESFSMWP